jgi:hypothetical protein
MCVVVAKNRIVGSLAIVRALTAEFRRYCVTMWDFSFSFGAVDMLRLTNGLGGRCCIL